MKKNLAFIAAAAIAAAMTACSGGSQQVNGTAAETEPALHDYTYVTTTGIEYSGTYTGGWENNMPNGEGSFESSSGNVTITGSWSNGQPNGQCRWVGKYDTYVCTYSGNMFFGVHQGNGDFKIADLNGNIAYVYYGEWSDDCYNGSGEETTYYTAEEAAESGCSKAVYKGGFSRGSWNGEGEYTVYFTAESAEQGGADYVVYTGQAKDGSFVEPYRYAYYKNNQIAEEGRVRDGQFVSDTEKAIGDFAYDILDDAVGDGFWGGVFDIIAPEIYDRNAE